MLVEEINQIRNRLIYNENQLAILHAHIYKRREEARNIRLSIPDPEQLLKLSATKLQHKKDKTLCSIHRLQEKTQQDLETFTKNDIPTAVWWSSWKTVYVFFMIGFILLVFVLWCAYPNWYL